MTPPAEKTVCAFCGEADAYHVHAVRARQSPALPVARCGDCRFYKGDADQDSEYGECRFKPPIHLPPEREGKLTWRSFPYVFTGDWCGEFVHRRLGARLPQPPTFIKPESEWSVEERVIMARLIAMPFQQWRFPAEEE